MSSQAMGTNDPQPEDLSYRNETNCIARKLLMWGYVKHNYRSRKALEEKGQLDIDDTPVISSKSSADYVSQQFERNMSEVSKDSQELESGHAFKAIYRTWKKKILLSFFLKVLNMLCKLGWVLGVQRLFYHVSQGQSSLAYLFVGIVSILIYVDLISYNNYYSQFKEVILQLRGAIVSVLLKKILTLTQYTISKEQLGKATNMISNDFNLAEEKAVFIMSTLQLPLAYGGAAAMLIVWLGPEGLICMGMPLVFMPLILYIGKVNGRNIEKMNEFKDKRVRIISDMIELLKQIKMYAWEHVFRKMIQQVRNSELSWLLKVSAGRAAEMSLANFVVYFGLFVTILVRSTRNDLTEDIIFASINLVTFLHLYNFFMVLGIGGIVEVRVMLKRFVSIYSIKNSPSMALKDENQEEMKINQESSQIQNGKIQLINFNGYWNKPEGEQSKPVLKNINLSVQKGKFYGLCGPVGCGKTSLFQVFLNELPFYSGEAQIKGKVSYCEQDLVIFSWTIRENILFGRPFDPQRYAKVVEASCLLRDFELLEHGENTLVGEKGITLSGGQKARIGLARALYSQADIYLFDDPLSAVDSKVAKEIFTRTFQLFLLDKTVILSTHLVNFLKSCDYVIVMNKGEVVSCEQAQSTSNLILSKAGSKIFEPYQEEKAIQASLQKSTHLSMKRNFKFLIYDSKVRMVLVVLIFLLAIGVNTAYLRILTFYEDQIKGEGLFEQNSSYWGLLGGLQALYLIMLYLMYFILYIHLNRTGKSLHTNMINRLLKCQPSYLDTTNSGYLSNVFSNDIGSLDNALFFPLQEAILGTSYVVLFFGNAIQLNPYFAIVFVISFAIILLVYALNRKLIVKSRELDLKAKSPIFSRLNQTAHGLIQIHLFGDSKKYIQKLNEEITNSIKTSLHAYFVTKGMDASVAGINFICIMIGLFIGISLIERDANYFLYAICLLCTLFSVFWTFVTFVYTESWLVCGARCLEVTQVPVEKMTERQVNQARGIILKQDQSLDSAANLNKKNKMPDGIHSIVLNNFKMRYRSGLPLVLKGLNLKIKKGEKVGIVGRTGAGKSSILQCLLRMYEPEPQSTYELMGSDALGMELRSLRKLISIIPQAPFLFKNTVRMNLDPEGLQEDLMVWSALEEANLKQLVKGLPEELNYFIGNPTEVFSVGQKQLFCLARALLRNSEVVIMDEATSNVDRTTDQHIQKVIKHRFKDITVITIAHRLMTIADYDRIVVMEDGRVKESGSPLELIEAKGQFYQMVHSSPAAVQIIQKAKQTSVPFKRNNFENE